MKKRIIINVFFVLLFPYSTQMQSTPKFNTGARLYTPALAAAKKMSSTITQHIKKHAKLYFWLSYIPHYGGMAGYYYFSPFFGSQHKTWQECHSEGYQKTKEGFATCIKNVVTSLVGAGRAARTHYDYRYFSK